MDCHALEHIDHNGLVTMDPIPKKINASALGKAGDCFLGTHSGGEVAQGQEAVEGVFEV